MSVRRNDGHVADAADVLERAPIVAGEEQRVGDRNERGALPARGDVAHAEIAHDVDAGSLGDDRGFAELPRRVRRLVPDVWPCDPMATHVGARHARFGEDSDRRVGEPFAEVESETAVLLRGAVASARVASRSRCAGVYVRSDEREELARRSVCSSASKRTTAAEMPSSDVPDMSPT